MSIVEKSIKVVLYARVSSKDQEREGYSIPAQFELLRNYAKKHNMIILKEYEDVETAKCAGRTNFNEMTKFLKSSKDCHTILVEKTDRLYRNLPDYITLDNMPLDLHFVKEGTILTPESHSSEKFMHLIKVGMARQYVQNLGEEVKKGLTQKAKEGYVTGKPPYGYKKLDKKISVIDDKTSPLVIRAFELYSKGNISLEKVACQLYNEGFVFKDTQAKIYKSQLEHILKNPFYYGMVQFKKELYEGKHEPIITKELFDITQKAFRKDNKPKYTQTHDFLFTGMLKCVHCGCVISGEIKKGKYIYYSCTGGKGECEQEHIYIKEEKLEKQIIEAISKIKITDEHKTWITTALADSFKDEQRYTKERLNSLNSQKDRLRERIDKLYLDKLDGIISEDFWLDKHNKWTNELKTIQENITAFENTNINFIEEGAKFLKICNEIDDLYDYADKNEKKELINYLLQNLTLNGENISYTYKKPFDIFAKGLSCNKKLPRLDSNQQPTG